MLEEDCVYGCSVVFLVSLAEELELVTENMCCWILCANTTGLYIRRYMFVCHVRKIIVQQRSFGDFSSCQSVTIEMAN